MKNAVYIFDVDGVINNITDYEPDERVLGHIAKLLDNGSFVAINTGRGYPWVKAKVIEGIREETTSGNLDHIFVAAEMGGVTVEFAGDIEQDERTAFSLKPEQIEQARKVYDDNAESKNMEWYKGKVSMATIAKPSGVEPAVFVNEANEIAAKLQELFAGEHVKVNVNPDALDVTTPEAGKWAGAQLIHDWLQRTPAANSKQFVCFGDNSSDYEMARYFGQQGHSVNFVFTGANIGQVVHDQRVTFTKTTSHYNEGTFEFLSTIAPV
jgi:HAD superfamily hydrolase (TIGR01484 family)